MLRKAAPRRDTAEMVEVDQRIREWRLEHEDGEEETKDYTSEKVRVASAEKEAVRASEGGAGDQGAGAGVKAAVMNRHARATFFDGGRTIRTRRTGASIPRRRRSRWRR